MSDEHLDKEFNNDLSELFNMFELCAASVVEKHLKVEGQLEMRQEVMRMFIVHLIQMAIENLEGEEGIEEFIDAFGGCLRDCFGKAEFATEH